jgi:hypothetical protein
VSAFSAQNLLLTVQRRIGSTLGGYVVHYGRYADPDQRGEPLAVPERAFYSAVWTELAAGLRGVHQLELNAFSRVGAPGHSDGDAYGYRVAAMAEHARNLWAPPQEWMQVYDFDDPQNPVPTDQCLLCINPRKVRGAPAAITQFRWDDETWRVRMYFEFKTVLDMMRSGQSSYHAR